MKILATILSLILILCSKELILFAQDNFDNEPQGFSLNSLPFGKPLNEITNSLKKSIISKVDFVSIKPLSISEPDPKDVKTRNFHHLGFNIPLDSKFVKQFSITNNNWKDVIELNLYFLADKTGKPKELFMIKKVLKPSTDDYKTVFNKLKHNINKIIDSHAKVSEMSLPKDNTNSEPTYLATWDINETKIGLFVTSFAPSEIIVISNSLFSKYKRMLKK